MADEYKCDNANCTTAHATLEKWLDDFNEFLKALDKAGVTKATGFEILSRIAIKALSITIPIVKNGERANYLMDIIKEADPSRLDEIMAEARECTVH